MRIQGTPSKTWYQKQAARAGSGAAMKKVRPIPRAAQVLPACSARSFLRWGRWVDERL